ncbi:hypothetical protein PV325_010896 [Microctonus aethiopoides]|uniref:Uncharacterized protein n=1 Tax=Microctonus aethiopoides TaxID=144406 RepID=A0AA39FHM3_9HYME|nr:hypothetical protein PV325_010896 [Microctonus aethiopoides]KAK0079143.1 hypothetical protein PV326_008909 [Microctonus aethiopoides]KAK0169755.1 hypothetical protein PV328_010397 [Microctonus aethiopoides]
MDITRKRNMDQPMFENVPTKCLIEVSVHDCSNPIDTLANVSQIFWSFSTGCISVKNGRIDNLKKRFSSFKILVFRSFIENFLESMGIKKFYRATPIHGSDSLFIQVQFPFLKTTVRPFVPEISSFECKRILFRSIIDIDATTGRTANPSTVPKQKNK